MDIDEDYIIWFQKVILLSKKPFANVKVVSGISLITL